MLLFDLLLHAIKNEQIRDLVQTQVLKVSYSLEMIISEMTILSQLEDSHIFYAINFK